MEKENSERYKGRPCEWCDYRWDIMVGPQPNGHCYMFLVYPGTENICWKYTVSLGVTK